MELIAMARFYAFTFPAPAPIHRAYPRRSGTSVRDRLRRLLDAIIESRMRRAEQDIQRLIGRNDAFADFARREGLDPHTALSTSRRTISLPAPVR
jgi:hypothetical protein